MDEPGRRPFRSQVVVDRLGVRLGSRQAHWEMIDEIVLYPYQQGGMLEPVPYVGVRLRNRPGLLGCPRGRLSRAHLERAVARHAPAAVPIVDAPLVAEDLQRYVARPIRGRWSRAPGAVLSTLRLEVVLWAVAAVYVWRVHPVLGVAAGLAILVPLGISARIRWAGATTLTVDGLGIALDGRVVGWPRIEAVALFDLRTPDGRTVPALGVARDLVPGGDPKVLGFVTLERVEFDRRALEATLATHAPSVAILDWPPARLTRTGELVR